MSAAPLVEALFVFAGVTVVTLLISVLGRLSPLQDYVQLAVAALFLWTAVQMSQRQSDGLARYGLRLGGLLDPPANAPSGLGAALLDLLQATRHAIKPALRETSVALLWALLIFPPFVLGFFLFHAPERAFELRLPASVASFLATQLIAVALPEEALFRGYFQGRLSEAFLGRMRIWGLSISLPALLIQALLFALIHFAVDLHPARLAVFFPGLLFGVVRAQRKGIGASAVLHAACNLLSEVLVRSWL